MIKLKWRITGSYLALTCSALLVTWSGITLGGKVLTGRGVMLSVSAAIVLTFILAYALARSFAGRIHDLAEDTNSLLVGLRVRTNVVGKGDELKLLGNNINAAARQFQAALEEVSQEKNKMAAILSGMLEGVIALDQTGKIVLLNDSAASMFGKQQGELNGKYFVNICPDVELEQHIRNVLNQGIPSHHEFDFQGRILRVLMSPVTAAQTVQGAVLVFQDVTAVRGLEQVRTEFVANVSHELRTPLTSIKGFAETLLDGADANPEVRQRFLQIIHAETARLQRLIEDLLTLSHLESRPRSALTVASVSGAYQRIADVLTSLAKAKNISLHVALDANLPFVEIGEELLSQIFLNLLENGIKYTPAGGKVWLEVSCGQDQVVIQVGDTGPGIPADSLPRIFERFYRVDRARSREMGGTGLGLSIVKHIVERADGQLSVSSQLGEGTVFTVNLPTLARPSAQTD
ncbi:MAG: ATP-binding protein [Peptococcaceae bacterium]|nr:ATP-binding protein [Peptococcaceae bacterium]